MKFPIVQNDLVVDLIFSYHCLHGLVIFNYNCLHALENLGHFVTAISMLLRCYVVDIVMNLESLKLRIIELGNFDELELSSQVRQP
jgi:hypothetical protein